MYVWHFYYLFAIDSLVDTGPEMGVVTFPSYILLITSSDVTHHSYILLCNSKCITYHWPTAKMVKIIDFLHQMCQCITTQIQFIREFTNLTISEWRFTEKIQKVI